MSKSAQDWLADWLCDAHAMECHAQDMLRKTAARLQESSPELAAHLSMHASIAEQQAERLRDCLLLLDKDSSTLKDLAARATGTAQAMTGGLAADELVRSAQAIHALVHGEIAAYTVLTAAADVSGQPETRRICELHLAQEQDMADWLDDHLGTLTRQFLAGPEQEAQRPLPIEGAIGRPQESQDAG